MISSSSSTTFDDDIYDKCAFCNKLQNAVSNLNEKPFLINTIPTCGHKFCEVCIQRQLNRKRSFLCPICNSAVTEDKLSSKTFEEIEVEKDVAMRRKVKALFNLTEDDFSSQEEYYNYQEKVEDIIYNLVHEIDIVETKKYIEEYERANKEIAAKKQLRLIQSLREEEQRIRDDDLAKAIRNNEYLSQIKREIAEKKEKKQHLNNALLGDADAQVALSAAQSSMSLVGGNGQNNGPSLAQAMEMMNPVKLFLNQRPEPKVVVASEELKASKKRKTISNQETHLLHAAGGYDHSQNNKRNWIEIHSQLKKKE